MPLTWTEKEEAGLDWFQGFMKHHPTISIRIPEATSLSRATSFNKHNVKEFFSKLSEVMDKRKFTPLIIWNVDVTGVTTVQKPCNVVAQTGIKQVGAVTLAERGTLETLCEAASATGNTVPPLSIFPRVPFKDHFLHDGPPGAVSTANKSGWMKEKDFLVFMHHFIAHVRPSKETPVLLLLGNHSSHLSIDVINAARDNCVVMLSFPPPPHTLPISCNLWTEVYTVH